MAKWKIVAGGQADLFDNESHQHFKPIFIPFRGGGHRLNNQLMNWPLLSFSGELSKVYATLISWRSHTTPVRDHVASDLTKTPVQIAGKV